MDSNQLAFSSTHTIQAYYVSSLHMTSFRTELSIFQSAIKVEGHCGFRISMDFARKNDQLQELDVPQEERV